ncbi:MAG: ABC transporter permease [Tannerellaceae bacterium]|jgi:putative ABC transport system permease protein|nr:ABC transporter permease [Tannerellaceae bacterium]
MKTILRNFLAVLRRFKMAVALNILGLSVAFAAFMMIMMQVDYDRNFDRSHPHADRIYRAEVSAVMGNDWQAIVNRPLIDAFIASSPHIVGGTYFNLPWQIFFSVESQGEKHFFLENALTASPGFPDVFTPDMLEGSDRALDDPEKALIPESLARKLFADEPATGKQLIGRDKTYTVGGVFRDFPANASTPNVIYLPIPPEENAHNWGNWNYLAYLRVNEPENAEGLFDNFKKNFDFSAMQSWNSNLAETFSIRLTPLAETHFSTDVTYDTAPKSSRTTLLILFGIAFVIVLIAGINYTNFSAALTPKRIKSINTQKVLGGDEGVIRFALLSEAVAIGLIAYLIALVTIVAAKSTPLAGLVDADLSLAAHPRLTALTGVLALLTGLLAGIYPARYMTSFPPALVLKGSFGLSPKGRQLRNVLISVQFIASFALIIGASFMYLQNRFMQHTSLGFGKDQLIVAYINDNINKGLDAFGNQLKNFAGIQDVTYSQFLLSSGDQYMGWGRDYHDREINYQCLPVDPSFLKVMEIDITEGRNFREEDALTRHGAYIFNEKARNSLDLALNDHIDSAEIIGFMPDVKFASLRKEVSPMAFYVWGTQNWGINPRTAYVKVKAGSDMRAAIEHVRNTLKEFDNEYPFNVRFFDEVLDRTYQKEQKLGTLISLFSLVTILISIVGVFGLVVFDSEYRRKEISLRKIFGSTTGGILLLFNKVYLRILALCFILAAPPAWYAVSRWLENFAYRTPLHWWVYPAAFAVVALFTIAVVTFQNWRAANANPVENIKAE